MRSPRSFRFLWLLLSIFLISCASNQEPIDYSIAVGKAYPNEAEIAQRRVDKYLAHLSAAQRERLNQNEYLAVEAITLPVAEVPGLSGQIATGKLQATSVYGQNPADRLSATARFIMIFDTKTGQPVGDEGYIVVDTPAIGKLGIFGGYTAVYIGRGR
jgi:hypothetical protein